MPTKVVFSSIHSSRELVDGGGELEFLPVVAQGQAQNDVACGVIWALFEFEISSRSLNCKQHTRTTTPYTTTHHLHIQPTTQSSWISEDSNSRADQPWAVDVHATTAATRAIRPVTAHRREPRPATTADSRVTFPASAPSLLRTRPATLAARLDTCPVSAPTHLSVVVVDSAVSRVAAVAVSATSAARSATSPATATRVVRVATVAAAMVVVVEATVVDVVVSAAVLEVPVARPATPAVATAT